MRKKNTVIFYEAQDNLTELSNKEYLYELGLTFRIFIMNSNKGKQSKLRNQSSKLRVNNFLK